MKGNVHPSPQKRTITGMESGVNIRNGRRKMGGKKEEEGGREEGKDGDMPASREGGGQKQEACPGRMA